MTHVQAVCMLSLLNYTCKGSSVSLQLLYLSSQVLVVFLEAPPPIGQILQEEINKTENTMRHPLHTSLNPIWSPNQANPSFNPELHQLHQTSCHCTPPPQCRWIPKSDWSGGVD